MNEFCCVTVFTFYSFLDYEHVGRTVLVDEGSLVGIVGASPLWIEGKIYDFFLFFCFFMDNTN